MKENYKILRLELLDCEGRLLDRGSTEKVDVEEIVETVRCFFNKVPAATEIAVSDKLYNTLFTCERRFFVKE